MNRILISSLFLLYAYSATAQTDPKSPELTNFKVFARRFFNAVKSKDTAYVLRHVLFPIRHATEKDGPIGRKYFLAHFSSFFSNDLISRLDKEAVYEHSELRGLAKEFSMTLYINSGGAEVNYQWQFEKKGNRFYFVTFRAELG
jgi:hypothetical protein